MKLQILDGLRLISIQRILAGLLAMTLFWLSASSVGAEGSSLIVHQWEAEHGMTSPTVNIIADSSASGGRYVALTSREETGSASYLINVPQAATYSVKGRIRVEGLNQLPFTVKWSQNWGEEFQEGWSLDSSYPSWEWVYGPTLDLSEGLVLLSVSYHEPRATIDKLELRLESRREPATPAQIPGKLSIYVDPESGSDSNNGAVDSPLKTLGQALKVVEPGWHIKLRSGIYEEPEIITYRAGLPEAPIVIEPDAGAHPIIEGDSSEKDGPRILHSNYTVRGLEIRDFDKGVILEGVSNVVFENNNIHRIEGECLRVSYFSIGNLIKGNTIHDCGLTRNGEGIYVGTATEQREKNDGKADVSILNWITNNELFRVSEGIDIKEDASYNLVTFNHVYQADSEDSGGINVRGDKNYFRGNLIENSVGSGFRFGGDGTYNPAVGGFHQYGVNNVLRFNMVRNNEGYGYKLIDGPQDIDHTNGGESNGGELYFVSSGAPLICSGPSVYSSWEIDSMKMDSVGCEATEPEEDRSEDDERQDTPSAAVPSEGDEYLFQLTGYETARTE